MHACAAPTADFPLFALQISQLDAWSKRLKQQQWEMENKIDDENKELRRTERKIQEVTRKYDKLCSELNAKTSVSRIS